MIEIILDFKDIKTEEELVLYARKKLGLPYKNRVGKWDAFIDDFRTILYKEWEEYNEEDWNSYEDYLKEKKIDAQYGVKNEKGVRDDMRLVFINYRKFFLNKKTRWLATMFLEILFEEIELINSDEWRIDGMMNKIEICIRS